MSRTLRTPMLAALVLMLGVSIAHSQVNKPVRKMTSARSANFYRWAALHAAKIPSAFRKQTRVTKLGQTNDGRTIMAVVPKLNRQQRSNITQVPEPARHVTFVVGAVTGPYQSRDARVLKPHELKALKIRQPDMAKQLAKWEQSEQNIFGNARGQVYHAGGSRSGKSYRFVQVLDQPLVSFGSYGAHHIPAGGTVERSVPVKAGANRWSSQGETAHGGKGYQWKSYGGKKMQLWKVLNGQATVVDNPLPQ